MPQKIVILASYLLFMGMKKKMGMNEHLFSPETTPKVDEVTKNIVIENS